MSGYILQVDDNEVKWAALLSGDRQVIEQFIMLVRTWPKLHEILPKAELDAEWNDLAQLIHMPREFLQLKWKRLRDKYRTELRKEMTSEGEYLSRWRYFSLMSFLRESEVLKMRPKRIKKPTSARPVKRQTTPPLMCSGGASTSSQNLSVQQVPDSVPAEPIPDHGPYRVPEPDPSQGTIDMGMDPDYSFLLTHIYPFLSSVEPSRKEHVYSALQQFAFEEYMRARSICFIVPNDA